MENKISHFQQGSHRMFHRRTTRGQQHTRMPLNFVKINQQTVFSDSANIVEYLSSGLSTPTKRLIINGSLGTRLAIAKRSYQTCSTPRGLRRCPKYQICPNWTNEHFFRSRNCLYVRFWSLNFVIGLVSRDSQGYGMCRNEIKP